MVAGGAGGCVTRTMAINSDPPGAAVWVNHHYVGRTPVEDLEFVHYGDYQVTLRREGHLAMSVVEKVRPPWYQRFGADLFSEAMLPGRLTDARKFDYKLDRIKLRSPEKIIADAEAARARLRALKVPGVGGAGGPAAAAPEQKED